MNVRFTSGPAELYVFHNTREQRHFQKHLWEWRGKMLTPTCKMDGLSSYREIFPCPLAFISPGGRSWPRDLRTTNTGQIHVRQESPAWVDTATACVHACVDMRAEGVTMRFVIHFVSVYSIIHPGVQWAANMPGTACDRVRQPRSEIFMRHFSVETEKRVQRYLSPWMAFWMQMHPPGWYLVSQKCKQSSWMV